MPTVVMIQAARERLAPMGSWHAVAQGPGLAKLYAALAAEVDGAGDLSDADSDPWVCLWKT